MKNIKEIKPILSALYCINFTNNKDKDIDKILKYAFNSILGYNTNLLTLCCIGKNKQDIMPDIWQVINEDTKYIEYNKRNQQNER